jgi:hypothetical protein
MPGRRGDPLALPESGCRRIGGVGRPLVDVFGGHGDVVHDRAVPRVEVIHHPLIAFVQVAVGNQPANMPLHGANVALGIVGDRARGGIGAAAMLVRVVVQPEQDQLADPVTTPHYHAEHERRGLDTNRSYPRGRQLASSRQRLAQLPNSACEHGMTAVSVEPLRESAP